jgi:heme exporter protein C
MNLAQQSPSLLQKGAKGSSRTTTQSGRLLRLITLFTLVTFLLGAYTGLIYAGMDTTQGNVQRIFYFHVASFSACSVAFAATVVGGIAYLRTRRAGWDRLALAGVEVGFSLSLITLITGMVWARPIWNTWWTWDPRLTSAAIMVLVYAAYLMLRNAIENPDKKRSLASVYGIFAFATVIFTFMVIRIRPDTIHPAVIGASPQNAEGGFAMTSTMTTALAINSIVWCCFVAPTLIWWRIRLEGLNEKVERLRAELQ